MRGLERGEKRPTSKFAARLKSNLFQNFTARWPSFDAQRVAPDSDDLLLGSVMLDVPQAYKPVIIFVPLYITQSDFLEITIRGLGGCQYVLACFVVRDVQEKLALRIETSPTTMSHKAG